MRLRTEKEGGVIVQCSHAIIGSHIIISSYKEKEKEWPPWPSLGYSFVILNQSKKLACLTNL